jgi:chaperonin GroEL (HSP60 family)
MVQKDDHQLRVKNFKNFQRIANVIHSMSGPKTRDQMATMFADALAKTNPNFNRSFFLKACQ